MRKSIHVLALVLAVVLFTSLFAGCSAAKDTASKNPPASGSSSSGGANTPTSPTPVTVDKPADEAVPAVFDNTVSPADETQSPLKISYSVHNKTIRDDEEGGELLYWKITYPVIDNPKNDKAIAAINEYYEKQFDHFLNTVIPEGKEAALEGKKSAKENKYDFYPFAFEKEAAIYYNDNNLLSVLHTGYENTGGAHPNSYLSSETFDIKTGKKLALSDIFGVNQEKALEKVYDTALSEIEKSKGMDQFFYFESYREDVKKNYLEEDFVLDHDGISFYYQAYSIAPYAAGIPVFKLSYEKAGDLAVKIPAVKSNELERELYQRAARLIDINTEVYFRIFGLSMLQLDAPEEIKEGEYIYPVKDKRFTNYEELDNYIRSTYIKSEADSLMGSGRYINKDGKLYGDMSKDGGKGYYVDWFNYRYEIGDISETSATITIYAVDDSPAGREDKVIKVKMLKENGQWLLENMFC